jgi:hypothetical protein
MNRIKGKEFVFTGRIRVPRHEAWALVESCKGFTGSSVTGATDFVVVGEAAGQKLEKATSRNLPLLTEEEFFGMIAEAKLDPEIQIPEQTSPDSPVDEPDTIISVEEFLKNATCFKCLDCGLAFAQRKDVPVTGCPLCDHLDSNWTDDSGMSYRDQWVLCRLASENPEIPVFPAMKCLVCGDQIPYSMEPEVYYCFNCRRYLTRQDTGDPETTGWKVGLVHSPADLYTLTKTLLLGGADWKVRPESSENGVFLDNEFGNVIFLNTAEFCKSAEDLRTRDYYNSLEFAIKTRHNWADRVPTLTPSATPTDCADLQPSPVSEEKMRKFGEMYDRKIERRQAARQRRFEKRQQKLATIAKY